MDIEWECFLQNWWYTEESLGHPKTLRTSFLDASNCRQVCKKWALNLVCKMPLIPGNPKDRIILGLMTFGPRAETGARITDVNIFREDLDVFQERGYHEVDTARAYVGREQEAFTREAGWKDRGLTLATKVKYPDSPGQNTAEKVVESVETSLKELGTDCIDLLYLHRPDRGVPFAETLEAVDKLHKQGKFQRLGISNFTAYEVAEVVMTCKYNNWVRPTVYQGMYNAMTRSLGRELIPACHRYGIDVVVYNPIAGGLFSGKYKTSDIPPEGRFSNAVGPMGEMYRKVSLALLEAEIELRW